MTKSTAGFLRLHVEGLPEPLPALATEVSAVEAYCRAFTEHTGWALRYAPRHGVVGRTIWSRKIASGISPSGGTLVLEPSEEEACQNSSLAENRVELASAKCLADSFGQVLTELERTRHALWQREAELAAGVPVSSRAGDELHLAIRLEAVLRGGAEAIGCQAAALYLLDEATSELKLRACYGLRRERLLEPARPLKCALADLEALIGHAVALEDVAALPHWKTPEDFPSALCVPVSSPSTPLGTLWLFSDKRRDFTSEQTNLVEIVAGRIAADLEREMLLEAGSSSRQQARDLSAAGEWQRNRLPYAPPLLDGWQVAGWTTHNDEPASSFYDWRTLDDGTAAVLLGGISGAGLATALSCAAFHSITKTHCQHLSDPGQILFQTAESFAQGSLGDDLATLFLARLDPTGGGVEYAAAGNLAAWLVGESGCQALAGIGPALGIERESPIQSRAVSLSPHDSLVIIGLNPRHRGPCKIPTKLICESLADRRRESASTLIDTVRAALASHARPFNGEISVLVIKRRP